MAGLQYHDEHSENLYAIQRLGKTFSDAIIGMAEAKAQQQRFQQSNMIAQQYLSLAQQEQPYKTAELQARTGNLNEETTKLRQANVLAQQTAQQSQDFGQAGAWANMSPEDLAPLLKDPKVGPRINSYLSTNNVLPMNESVAVNPRFSKEFGTPGMPADAVQRKLRAAMAAYAFKMAGRNPAEAASLLEPHQFTPGSMMGRGVILGNDPSQMQQVPFGQMSPYQQGQLGQGRERISAQERHNLEMEDIARQNAESTGIRAGKTRDYSKPAPGSFAEEFNKADNEQPGGTNAPVKISSKKEYDALPDGASYIDDSGQTKIKGKK